MTGMIRIHGDIVERADLGKGLYRAVIAVNDEIPGHSTVALRDVSFTDYMRNPVVLFNHDRHTPPGSIGRTISLAWTERGLEAVFEFLPKDPRAATVKNAWDRKFLRAASLTVKPVYDGTRPRLLCESGQSFRCPPT